MKNNVTENLSFDYLEPPERVLVDLLPLLHGRLLEERPREQLGAALALHHALVVQVGSVVQERLHLVLTDRRVALPEIKSLNFSPKVISDFVSTFCSYRH